MYNEKLKMMLGFGRLLGHQEGQQETGAFCLSGGCS